LAAFLGLSFSSPGFTGDGRASRSEAVRLADYGIAADPAQLVGDLAGGRAFRPHRLQAIDPFFSPGHR
jgi:hypothetical protein